jgi:LytS/YehU family sensor histidine kinase
MGRLEVSLEVPTALHGAKFPPLLLMTLVENSVKHGIEPRPGPGRITLRAAASDDVLEVEVRDDGAGLREATGGGLGLANLRASLHARYGEHASFVLTGGVHGGASATVRIPLEAGA